MWYYHAVEAGPATSAPAHNHVVPETVDEAIPRQRAAAQNILSQGTDGIYMFNYPCKLFERKRTPDEFARLQAVLYELGDANSLRGKAKQYTFWNGLPLQLESCRPPEYHQTLRFHLRDPDVLKDRCKARLRFRQVVVRNPHMTSPQSPPDFLPSDWIHCILNGKTLDARRLEHTRRPAEKIDAGFELGEHEQIEISTCPGELRNGENTLAFHVPKMPDECDPYVYIHQFTVDTTY